MIKRNITLFFVFATLIAALFAVQAFALPDNPPTCSLSSDTEDTWTRAMLVAVAVDTLGNAGMDTIRLYEDGNLIHTENCQYSSTCVLAKPVFHDNRGVRDYHAVCRDISGQETTSDTVSIDFKGRVLPFRISDLLFSGLEMRSR